MRVLCAIVVCASACSFLKYRAPEMMPGPEPTVRCRTGVYGPVLDFTFGLLSAAVGVGTIVRPTQADETDAQKLGAGAGFVAAGALLAASGAWGAFKIGECNDALERYPAYVPPPEIDPGDSVQVTADRRDVERCALINNFRGEGSGYASAVRHLRRLVASYGADTVLITGESPNGQAVAGEGYACSGSATPPATTASPSGCDKDTDCKGDRICVERQCVSPPTSPAP